jgi:hypothetical protein
MSKDKIDSTLEQMVVRGLVKVSRDSSGELRYPLSLRALPNILFSAMLLPIDVRVLLLCVFRQEGDV